MVKFSILVQGFIGVKKEKKETFVFVRSFESALISNKLYKANFFSYGGF